MGGLDAGYPSHFMRSRRAISRLLSRIPSAPSTILSSWWPTRLHPAQTLGYRPRPATLGSLLASVMTKPSQECPTRRTGPDCAAMICFAAVNRQYFPAVVWLDCRKRQQ